MKIFLAACFVLALALATQVFAQTPVQNPVQPPAQTTVETTAAVDTKNIIRISPPLKTLLKNFTPNPNAEAEILSRNTQITIDENYFSQSVSYVAIYINSDEAVRDYSQISISFNSFYEDITLEFANVRTPEGDMDTIKPDATQIQSPSDENFYQDRKDLLFSLPNVRKGSIIEFQYRNKDSKKIISNQWFDSFSMNWWEGRAAGQGVRSDAVLNTEVSITAPQKITFYSNDLTHLKIAHTRQQKSGVQTLSWKGKNLPKIELQDSMPRVDRRSTQLRVSTLESWQGIAKWANQLAEPHVVSDANLDKLINSIGKTATTPEDKAKAVYKAIQEKVRYVFAHVGRGGYEPHNAFEVLTNGYGDCKDQTILAVTMLRKLGVKADAALVLTRSRGLPDMKITSVNFDHMIVHIPAQSGLAETWMDTSGDKGLYPGFSVGLEGQPALVVNEATQSITTIAELPASQHFVHLDLAFDKIDGKNINANFSLKLGGEFEQRLRGMWQYSRERDKSFREMVGRIYSNAEVSKVTANNADSLWQSFYLTGQFKFNNAWNGAKEPLTYGFNITQLIYLFTNFRDIHKPADRLQDYEISPGNNISAHITFLRPSPNHLANVSSQGQNVDNEFFSLSQKGREENGNYILDINLSIKNNRFTPQEYNRFYEQVHRLLDANDWTVIYRYDNNAADMVALKEAIAKTGKAPDFIKLARLQIKIGEYDKALDTAKRAVKSEPQNAEAHYILGLTQGYNNQLNDSERSFAKAEELGFKI
jgi:tetratricopeptide (TPR) repeat protein